MRKQDSIRAWTCRPWLLGLPSAPPWRGALAEPGCDVVGAGLAGGRVFGHGCSLRDKLADQGLGHGMSPSAGFLEDVLVESSERVAELCTKFVSGHGI